MDGVIPPLESGAKADKLHRPKGSPVGVDARLQFMGEAPTWAPMKPSTGSACEFAATGVPNGDIMRLQSSYDAPYLPQNIEGSTECWQTDEGDGIGE